MSYYNPSRLLETYCHYRLNLRLLLSSISSINQNEKLSRQDKLNYRIVKFSIWVKSVFFISMLQTLEFIFLFVRKEVVDLILRSLYSIQSIEAVIHSSFEVQIEVVSWVNPSFAENEFTEGC